MMSADKKKFLLNALSVICKRDVKSCLFHGTCANRAVRCSYLPLFFVVSAFACISVVKINTFSKTSLGLGIINVNG